MRELKFRGFDLEKKIMIDPDISHRQREGIVVMQFTGLLDKNGKDIYFSDVCKYKDDSGSWQIGVVKDYGYLKGYIEAIGGDDEGNQDGELHPDYQKDYEVLGNIYQNPELLETK
jgi:uncharacterized phage protein (TIGR01671 family)